MSFTHVLLRNGLLITWRQTQFMLFLFLFLSLCSFAFSLNLQNKSEEIVAQKFDLRMTDRGSGERGAGKAGDNCRDASHQGGLATAATTTET